MDKINVPLTQKAVDILVALVEAKLEEAADHGNEKVIVSLEDVLEQLETAS